MHSGDIQTAWKRMLRSVAEDKHERKGFLTEVTGTTLSNGHVRLGVSSEEHFSILIPSDVGQRVDRSQKSAFISIDRVPLVVGGARVEFTNVSCDEPELMDVFAKLVADIVHRIERGHSSSAAIDEALEEFRRLLRLPSLRAPDIRTTTGLVGELLVLVELLRKNDKAWAGWHGPASDRHDFRAGGVSIEVKASLGADGRKIHVHGIRQLEHEVGSSLVLKHIRLEPDPTGDLTVPALVKTAMRLASDPDLLRDKLSDLGFFEEESELWGHHAFRSFDDAAYDVSEGFPRLVPGLLNIPWPLVGVSEVSYVVDLAAASELALSEEEWNHVVEEFCLCL